MEPTAVRICARQARSYRVIPDVMEAVGAALAREASLARGHVSPASR